LTFRSAGLADAEAVVSLIESAYRGMESRRGWTTEADFLDSRRTSIEAIMQIITAPGSRMLVAETAGQLIGCCHVQSRTAGEAYLGLVSVRPHLQDRGVGRTIVANAEREARARWGAKQMRLRVIRQRVELIAWYERLGYQPTGETLPFPYDNPSVIATRSDLDFVLLAKPI
jgi:ribosomal protein S18 acetylase RimI-like enzyme